MQVFSFGEYRDSLAQGAEKRVAQFGNRGVSRRPLPGMIPYLPL
jgi:hypothetical protein